MSFRNVCAASLMAVSVAVIATPAGAQDFSVYTRQSYVPENVEGKPAAGPSLLSRCISLFHAGKVYDRGDGGNQMTIFEPAHQQFVIVDGSRRRMVVVSFDEINTRLHRLESRDADHLARLRGSTKAHEIKLRNYLELQLLPTFQANYDEGARLLELSRGKFNYYSAQVDSGATPERVAAYLDYADWAARLNCIIDPRAPLPGPRLKLNDELRQRSLLPTEVTRKTDPAAGYHITAEHQFVWKFNDTDRDVIRHWEQMLNEADIKRWTLEEYLRAKQKESTAAREPAGSTKGTAKINPASARTRGGR